MKNLLHCAIILWFTFTLLTYVALSLSVWEFLPYNWSAWTIGWFIAFTIFNVWYAYKHVYVWGREDFQKIVDSWHEKRIMDFDE